MTNHAVTYSPLSGTIYAGTIAKDKRSLRSKTDVTTEAIHAVASLVTDQYDGEVVFTGHGMKIAVTITEDK